MEFKDQTGTIFIEGVLVHGAYALDGIRTPSGTNKTFIIQNTRLETHAFASGLTDVADRIFHTDGFQSWGGINGLYMNRVTIVNPYQGGMFGDGVLSSPWKTTVLDKVNFRADTKVGQKAKLINFVTSNGNLHGPFTFQGKSVYYQLGPDWTWSTVYVGNGTTSPQGGFYSHVTIGSDAAGQYAEPKQNQVLYGINNGSGGPGRIYRGIPPTGDYVPLSVPGMNYVSPGYN